MSKVVRVRIVSEDKVVQMTEMAALRLAEVNPKEYLVLESPKIEITSLPPLAEKKSVVVAETNEVETQEVIEAKKRGRPAKNTI